MGSVGDSGVNYYMKFCIDDEGRIVSEIELAQHLVERASTDGVGTIYDYIVRVYTGTKGSNEDHLAPIYYAMWDGEKAV